MGTLQTMQPMLRAGGAPSYSRPSYPAHVHPGRFTSAMGDPYARSGPVARPYMQNAYARSDPFSRPTYGYHSVDEYHGSYPDSGPRYNYPDISGPKQALSMDWYYGGHTAYDDVSYGGSEYYDRNYGNARHLQAMVGHQPAYAAPRGAFGYGMNYYPDFMQPKQNKEEAELRALFKTLDVDGNDTVDSKEWGKAVGKNFDRLQGAFGGASKAEVGQMFRQMDADGDGVLSWDEVQHRPAFVYNARPPRQNKEEAELRALFKTLDVDGNG